MRYSRTVPFEATVRDGELYARGAVDRLHRYDKGKVVQSSAAFTSGASGGDSASRAGAGGARNLTVS